MKKSVKFSVAALCIAVLAACSSGGGSSDGDKKQNNANTNNSTLNNKAPAPNTTPSVVDKNANIAGSGLKVGTVTKDSVIVDGKTLTFNFPRTTIGQGRFNNWGGSINGVTAYFDRVVSGSEYFGVTAENRTSQKYAFYGSSQEPTSVMPVSGLANYEGDVIYAYGGASTRGEATVKGDAKLTADFGMKKLTGTFEKAAGGTGADLTATVNADISGSGFTGKVATPTNSADLVGKFYGANAAAVTGVFGDGNNQLSGAFGAQKK